MLAELRGFVGPIPLSAESLDWFEREGLDGHGVCVLGSMVDNVFVPHRVSRSDDRAGGVIGCVRQHIRDPQCKCCTHMWFKYALSSAPNRFDEECRIFHALGGADKLRHNASHPDRPNGQPSLRCKYCKHFG